MWWWVALWCVLVVFALGVFAVLFLSLFRGAMALLREVEQASIRLGELQAVLAASEAVAREPAPDMSVFTSPMSLRQRRYLERRLRDKQRSRRRSSAIRPTT